MSACLSACLPACLPVQCRVGLLHYLNPMKPEGFHTADLSIREERVLAKILAALSFVEPGENWVSAHRTDTQDTHRHMSHGTHRRDT